MGTEIPFEEKLKTNSLSELLDIKEHIDKEKYPDRYLALLNEIENRPTEVVTLKGHFTGKRFYQPWVLAVYCAVANLPFGIFLYGLNVHRRGDFWIGKILMVVSGLAVIGIYLTPTGGIFDKYAIPIFFFNLFMGLGLMKAEENNYKKAILNGGGAARWWPPLIFLAAILFAMWAFNVD